MDEDLFSLGGDAPAPRTLSDRNRDHRAPLAVRMRPRTLEEVVGQQSALEPGSPLRRLVGGRRLPDVAQLGDPVGPSRAQGRRLSPMWWRSPVIVSSSRSLQCWPVSRTSARWSTRRARGCAPSAGRPCSSSTRCTASRNPSRTPCCPSVENRWVTLIAATTENPYFSVISPLLSRSIVLTLESAGARGPRRARRPCPRGRARISAGSVTLAEDAREALLRLGGGDARKILTSLEAAAAAALMKDSAGDRCRDPRPGRQSRRGALRPGRGSALRRHQRLHQVDARAAMSMPPCIIWHG